MTVRSWLQVAVAGFVLGVLPCCGSEGEGSASQSGLDLPVITPEEAWNAYPTAIVKGRLKLENGCLVVDGHVVFWPKGTTWDGESESVVSDGNVWATVGEGFEGGGGYYDGPVDYRELLGNEPGTAMGACIDLTGAAGAVFAYESS